MEFQCVPKCVCVCVCVWWKGDVEGYEVTFCAPMALDTVCLLTRVRTRRSAATVGGVSTTFSTFFSMPREEALGVVVAGTDALGLLELGPEAFAFLFLEALRPLIVSLLSADSSESCCHI